MADVAIRFLADRGEADCHDQFANWSRNDVENRTVLQ